MKPCLTALGKVPLPPYIRRGPELEPPCDDRTAYQTVYASEKGAIAAPTAGLHFTSELLERLKAKGITIVSITLHVGYGTFLPVRAQDIRSHQMHSEAYSIPGQAADQINSAPGRGISSGSGWNHMCTHSGICVCFRWACAGRKRLL